MAQANEKTKLNLRLLSSWKKRHQHPALSMLTCYDYSLACVLNQSDVDLILVGDSLGNVILGLENTIGVTPEDMMTFGRAVKRGCPQKFVVVDIPFGIMSSLSKAQEYCFQIFQYTGCEAIKIEGASPFILELVHELTTKGVPVMGHIGLLPQSVHQQGGHYTHGKNEFDRQRLLTEALNLEKSGAFAIVLECVQKNVASEITDNLNIPTIGIGSGQSTDGQVLVLHDLLGLTAGNVPSFVKPVRSLAKELIEDLNKYHQNLKQVSSPAPTIEN